MRYEKVLINDDNRCKHCVGDKSNELCDTLFYAYDCTRPNAIFKRIGKMKIMILVEDFGQLQEGGKLIYRNIELDLTPDQKAKIELKETETIIRMHLVDR